MSYRKKPVVVEAHQIQKNDSPSWPDWLHAAFEKPAGEPGALTWNDTAMLWEVETYRGKVTAQWGDYIILTSRRELSICNPQLFERIYEKV